MQIISIDSEEYNAILQKGFLTIIHYDSEQTTRINAPNLHIPSANDKIKLIMGSEIHQPSHYFKALRVEAQSANKQVQVLLSVNLREVIRNNIHQAADNVLEATKDGKHFKVLKSRGNLTRAHTSEYTKFTIPYRATMVKGTNCLIAPNGTVYSKNAMHQAIEAFKKLPNDRYSEFGCPEKDKVFDISHERVCALLDNKSIELIDDTIAGLATPYGPLGKFLLESSHVGCFAPRGTGVQNQDGIFIMDKIITFDFINRG